MADLIGVAWGLGFLAVVGLLDLGAFAWCRLEERSLERQAEVARQQRQSSVGLAGDGRP